MLEKQIKRNRRHRRVRSRIKGTAKVPRLCVFRSNQHIYAQLIDDEQGKTLVVASDLMIKSKTPKQSKLATGQAQIKNKKEERDKKMLAGKVALAYEVGKLIAKKAAEKKIKKVVFDRGGYKYHGRVKVVAEGAKEEGLKF